MQYNYCTRVVMGQKRKEVTRQHKISMINIMLFLVLLVWKNINLYSAFHLDKVCKDNVIMSTRLP